MRHQRRVGVAALGVVRPTLRSGCSANIAVVCQSRVPALSSTPHALGSDAHRSYANALLLLKLAPDQRHWSGLNCPPIVYASFVDPSPDS